MGNLRALQLAIAAISIAGSSAVQAADGGTVIRDDSLKDKPFIDAATIAEIGANAPVNILARQGGWMQVDAGGKSGWLRMLNVRMVGGGGKPGSTGGGLMAAASLYRTGSSGTTVTTGVKGLGEEDLRSAQPNPQQMALLAGNAVTAADGAQLAAGNGLKASQIAYLKAGKK